jgi:RHS repeat-associated protein
MNQFAAGQWRRPGDAAKTSTVEPADARSDRRETAPAAPPPVSRVVDLLPHVTLPKGGGAIRDIGEKFSVNAATGTSSISIPLPLSPGRSGFTPDLPLAYDSGSGNGPFGFGWSLSLPSITRKTDKGLPRYCDADESDVFILSGAEDLVPLLDESGERVHVPPRTVHGVLYQITRYRPRIEGLFTRIERWVAVDTGISHWRSVSRSNVTTLYGFDAGSRIADPDRPGHIFSYRICRSWDDKGNVAIYTYVAEDGIGVDRTPAHEINRTDAIRGAQSYLKSVSYGNLEPYAPDWSAAGGETALPSHWMFTVVFDYGDHRDASPTPVRDRAWTVRPDPFSTYRGGFEARTYRRVRRILFFNNFPDAAAVGADCLVRSLDLTYSDQQTTASPLNPVYTFLVSATQTGYTRDTLNGAADYTSASMPPLEFAYSQPQIQSSVQRLDRDSAGNLPEGIDGTRFRWVDLDGEGLSGILCDGGGQWQYKRNVSASNLVEQPDGRVVARARFGPLETIAPLPAAADLSGDQRFLDLAGAGRLELVNFGAGTAGFFKRTASSDWEPYRSFSALPSIDWAEPNLTFIDLTGDGLADALVTEDGVYTYYPSLGDAGFDSARRVPVPWDEERGPAVVLAGGSETIFLADMNGDGLNDIVRVRNGETCYWPNLGYGRFGAKVTTDGAPRFDSDERFDPRRVKLADIDGTGTTDLLYATHDGTRVWFNQSGNSWSAANDIGALPTADSFSSVQVVDLLGTGTACLVWSSPLPAESTAPLLYIDLMGGQKPHLMVRMRNNLGAETRVAYAPSTRFYVADAQAGRPWVTRLPFPVQVVERLETIDWIGRNRTVSRYAYHHGYFDGYEREFRGFGMVEQWDTEEYRADTAFPDGELLDFLNWNAASWSPPILTRSWFHTGAFLEAPEVSQQYAAEYWIEPALRSPAHAEDAAAMLIADTVLPADLNPLEVQEAYRALKGRPIRIEVFADDGSSRAADPYSVVEQNFSIRCLQQMGSNLHAIFLVTSRETVTFHYERNAGDPRVTHDLTLGTDNYGNVTRAISIGYPRRAGTAPPEPALATTMQAMLASDQSRLHIVATEHQYTNAVDDIAAAPDLYRAPAPAATNVAEITGVTPSSDRAGITNLFTFSEIDLRWADLWSGAHDVAYELVPAADVDGAGALPIAPRRRFIEQRRTVYRSDDLAQLLPVGQLQSRSLPGDTYQAALTPGLVSSIFGALVSPSALEEGGYVQLAGETGWWAPSGRVYYSPGDADAPATELAAAAAAFFMPRRAVDPFGAIARVDYDAAHLLPIAVTDPVGNVTASTNDYRVLAPSVVSDANGNRSAAAFDALGRVAGTAVMGKITEAVGDSLSGFVADLDAAIIAAHLANPGVDPSGILGSATARFVTDSSAYWRTRDAVQPTPTTTYALRRETHVSDVAGGAEIRYRHQFVYSDGFGREVQTKALAAPGPLTASGPDISPRWIGSGWTIFNNKGNPVRIYEPFFSATGAFEFAVQAGVSTIRFYDPAARAIATLRPDNTWEKTAFDCWRQATWDADDTCLIGDPRADADVGNAFTRLLGTAPNAFTSWHDQRSGGTFGATADARAAQQDAAQKAAAHAATPGVAHFDSLGRTCLTVADNGSGERYATRTALDCEGKPLATFDASGRRVIEYVLRAPLGGGAFQYVAGTDLAGRALYHNSADGGERRSLANVAGNLIRNWDAREHAFRLLYDPAQRQTHRYVSTAGAPPILIERTVYGEGQAAANLCGQRWRAYDAAGVVSADGYDYKGNLTSSSRQLGIDYRQSLDWTPLGALSGAAELDAASVGLLSLPDRFESSTVYDALNRPIQIVTPHNATTRANVLRHGFDEAGQLAHVDAWLQVASAPVSLLDPATADHHVVTSIDYNARGQRIAIAAGNGTMTTYAYDPETFRLVQATATRPAAFAADQRVVQDLAYFYDAVGNVTRIRDNADIQNVIYFDNQRVEPSADYTYDAIYRLVAATGREHLGQSGGALSSPQQVTDDDAIRVGLPQPGDGTAMGVYTETYSYDAVGNLLALAHQVGTNSWTRRYEYAEPSLIVASETSNRLTATSLPGDPVAGPFTAVHAHDAHGNMVRMPHLPAMTWDERDRLRSTTRQVVVSGTPRRTFYVHNGDGERVRKTTDTQSGGAEGMRANERIYLGAVEIYREFDSDGTTVTRQRETLDVAAGDAGGHPIAFVETRTIGTDPGLAQLVRYQHANHLGSAVLELDDQSNIITYEEYFPFGSTSYQAVRNATDTPKRYRYTGKELDSESDLYYHGARYYAPWLGRWTACDPAGLADGPNVYAYARNNPLTFSDPSGTQGENETINTPPPPDPPRPSVEDALKDAKPKSHWGGALQDAAPGELPDPIPPVTEEDIERLRKLVGPIVPELKFSFDPIQAPTPWFVPVDTSLPADLRVVPPPPSPFAPSNDPTTVWAIPPLPPHSRPGPADVYPDVYANTRVGAWSRANQAPPLKPPDAGGTAPAAAVQLKVVEERGYNNYPGTPASPGTPATPGIPVVNYLRYPLGFFSPFLLAGGLFAALVLPNQQDPDRTKFADTALGVATGVLSGGASEKLKPFKLDVKLGVDPLPPRVQQFQPHEQPGPARQLRWSVGVSGVF